MANFALLFSIGVVVVLAQPFDPNTPIETIDGSYAPLSNCLFRAELEDHMADIGQEMTSFGISRGATKAYQSYVENEAAKQAAANATVVCITRDDMNDIGSRLGKIILKYLDGRGPLKRGSRGSGNGSGGKRGFEFNGDKDDSFHGGKVCCKCAKQGEYLLEGARSACPIGPCCPQLCKALWAIGGQASDGPKECCRKSELPCLHQRESGRKGNRNGARSSRGRFT